MTIHQDARKLWSGDPQEVRATMAGHVRVQPAEESPMSEAKSSNLVARLEAIAVDAQSRDRPTIYEAAAEIKRLESCIRGLSSHAMKASAEETRLRAALKKHGEHLGSCRTKDWTTGKHSWDDETCDCGLITALRGEVETPDPLASKDHGIAQRAFDETETRNE